MSMTVIQHIPVGSGGAASIEFTAIPQTYTDLKVVLSARTDSSTFGVVDTAIIYFNTDTASTTNYTSRTLYGAGSGSGASDVVKRGAFTTGATATASTFGSVQYYIPNYTAAVNKSVSIDGVSENNATAAYQGIHAWLWSDTDAIDTITLKPETGGDFVQYSSATLYGITSAVEPMTYTLPVTSDLYAWYDAANTSSITSSSGFVSEWADSSGNGINAVQATGSLQPAYGPVVCNGIIVPYFNVDRLVANASLVGNALTVFTVGSKESQGGLFSYSRWASIWKDGAGANDYANTDAILGVWANTIYAYSNNAAIATISSSAVNTIQNSALRLDGSNVKTWSNGSTATGTASTSLNADRITIGDASLGTGDSYLNGFVAEHIIYNRALTDQEVADVQTYLANKWNL